MDREKYDIENFDNGEQIVTVECGLCAEEVIDCDECGRYIGETNDYYCGIDNDGYTKHLCETCYDDLKELSENDDDEE